MKKEKLKVKRGYIDVAQLETISKKSISSIILLPLLIILLGFTNYQKDHQLTHNIFVAFMLFWSLIRMYNSLRFNIFAKQAKLEQWWNFYRIGAIVNAFSWGLYSAFAIYVAGTTPPGFYIVMICFGITSGAVSSMYMDLRLIGAYIFLICIPIIFSSYFYIAEVVAIGVGFQLFHALSHARLQYKMFWQGQDSKQLLETVIDAVPGPLSYVNSDLEYIGINRFLADFLNVSAEEVVGKPIGFIEKKGEFRNFVKDFFASSEQQFTHELEVQVENRKVPMLMVASKFNQNKYAVIIGVDVSERVKAQEELEHQRALNIEASKLASLGEMAGGIAHELNTPLAIISGRAESIRKLLDKESDFIQVKQKISDKVDSIDKTAGRIAKIIKGMRQIARNDENEAYAKTQLREIIEDTLSLSQEKVVGNGFQLELDLPPEDLSVECLSTQVSQVLLNLVNNAFDANLGTEKPWIRVAYKDLGEVVQIRVFDSGHGISDEVKQKLFQPFFTTKDVGHGMGLGLSISKSIIEQHNGRLFVDDSETNTCFVIELPKRQKTSGAA